MLASGRVKVVLLTPLLLFALGACSRGDARIDGRTSSEEARELDGSLDRLEERLLEAQANVDRWEDLRQRHEQVSEIACQNLAGHAREMAALAEHQRGKRRVAARNGHTAARLIPPAEPRR